jgi:peptidoglycan/LPS O-acetylase OafA/YrhL
MNKHAVTTLDKGLSVSVLDAARGLAALYVVLHHARFLLWISQTGYVASGGHGLGLIAASLSASLIFGHQAVMLFFMISGFCIHYRQAQVLAAGQSSAGGSFSFKMFAARRVRRLYPMLLVAMGLTLILDRIGMLVDPSFYSGQAAAPEIRVSIGVPEYSVPVLLGGLLMQGGLAVPQFGSNVPLWSLSYEAWFYVLYPALLWLSTRIHVMSMVVVTATLSLLSLLAPAALPVPTWFLPILSYWFVWALGALIAEVYVGRVRVRGLRWYALAAAGGTCLLLGQIALNHAAAIVITPGTEILLSVTLAVLLTYALTELPARLSVRTDRAARRLGWLGAISYPLYIIHYPMLAFLSAVWLSRSPGLPQGAELVIAGVGLSLLLAWVCWYLVERHCISPARPGGARADAALVATRASVSAAVRIT